MSKCWVHALSGTEKKKKNLSGEKRGMRDVIRWQRRRRQRLSLGTVRSTEGFKQQVHHEVCSQRDWVGVTESKLFLLAARSARKSRNVLLGQRITTFNWKAGRPRRRQTSVQKTITPSQNSGSFYTKEGRGSESAVSCCQLPGAGILCSVTVHLGQVTVRSHYSWDPPTKQMLFSVRQLFI